jgi:hypothetical protein
MPDFLFLYQVIPDVVVAVWHSQSKKEHLGCWGIEGFLNIE